jgi:hypothetical protein
MQQEAEVLARGRGWITHEDLAPGDEILAYDPADDTARWDPVRSVHRFKVGGDLIRWRSKQIDVLTTPDHSWWTVGRSGRSPYRPRFCTTAEVSGHQFYVKIGGGAPAGFATTATVDNDVVELVGWVFTEGWFVRWRDQRGRRPVRERICQRCGGRPAVGRRGPPRCESCRSPKVQLQAERRAAQRASQPPPVPRPQAHYAIGFCQSQTANPQNVARIRDLVDRLVTAGHRISETQYRARYNNSVIRQWHFAGTLGRTVRELLPDKRLTPRFVERLTAAQAQLLLDVLILADGHTDRHGHRQFIQKDSGQLDVVTMLCAMLGIRTSRLGRGGARDSLYLATTNRLMGAAVNARLERYDGIVWSPHLRTGILLARCNGRTFWTGNINIRNEVGNV